MVSRRNVLSRQLKTMERTQTFAIRKLSVGIASVAIASGLAMLGNVQVAAEEIAEPVIEQHIDATDEEPVDNTSDHGSQLLDESGVNEELSVDESVYTEPAVDAEVTYYSTDDTLSTEEETPTIDSEVTEKEITYNEIHLGYYLPFETKETEMTTLPAGERKVIQEGERGLRIVKVRQPMVNGQPVGEIERSEEIVSYPKNKIIHIGT